MAVCLSQLGNSIALAVETAPENIAETSTVITKIVDKICVPNFLHIKLKGGN